MVDEEEVVMTAKDDVTDTNNAQLICGVVEGFYGRPWTTEQRKDLFRKYVFFPYLIL